MILLIQPGNHRGSQHGKSEIAKHGDSLATVDADQKLRKMFVQGAAVLSRAPQEIRHVTSILEDGRYAVACVKARVAGAPLPVKRVYLPISPTNAQYCNPYDLLLSVLLNG